MKRIPPISLVVLVCAALGSACLLFLPPEPPPKPTSNWTLREAREFEEFELFWLGESYEGLPLSAMLLEDPQYNHKYRHASFYYGEFWIEDANSPSWSSPLFVEIFYYCDEPDFRPLDPEAGNLTSIEILGNDGYKYYNDIHTWSGRSAILVSSSTSRTGFRVEDVARDLIPISLDTGTEPRPLPPPTSPEC